MKKKLNHPKIYFYFGILKIFGLGNGKNLDFVAL